MTNWKKCHIQNGGEDSENIKKATAEVTSSSDQVPQPATEEAPTNIINHVGVSNQDN